MNEGSIILLSSKEIEDQIVNYELIFSQIRDQRIEWKIPLPMFLDTFEKIFDESNRIPTQAEFVDGYFSDNSLSLQNILSNPSLKMGLEARLRRTYPSFVRDAHLGSLLREKGLAVKKDRDLDVLGGIDFTIEYKGQAFYIHCFTSTRYGRYGRRVKEKRHEFKGIHLDVEMNFDSDLVKRVGDFRLYSEKHVEKIIEAMDSELKKQTFE